MKDFRLDLRLRNNRILRKIEAAGYRNVRQFCVAHGMHPNVVGALVNLKESPFKAMTATDGRRLRDGEEWRAEVLKLAAALACSPWDLFSEDLLRQREATRASLELDAAQAAALSSSVAEQLAIPPDVQFSRKELTGAIAQQLESLSPREALVIRRRFGLDGEEEESLREIGRELGVTQERIRQIETRALRKLRQVDRARQLRPYRSDS